MHAPPPRAAQEAPNFDVSVTLGVIIVQLVKTNYAFAEAEIDRLALSIAGFDDQSGHLHCQLDTLCVLNNVPSTPTSYRCALGPDTRTDAHEGRSMFQVVAEMAPPVGGIHVLKMLAVTALPLEVRALQGCLCVHADSPARRRRV